MEFHLTTATNRDIIFTVSFGESSILKYYKHRNVYNYYIYMILQLLYYITRAINSVTFINPL